MSPTLTWMKWSRPWVTPMVVLALLVGTLAPPLAKRAAAADFTISGTVSDANGPLANIAVAANPAPGGVVTTTLSDGSYTMTVPPGNYFLQFQDPALAHPPGFYSSAGFTIYQDSATLVHATSGNVSGIDVVMPVGYTISGIVSDANGPLSGIWVSVFAAPPAPKGSPPGPSTDLGATTDASGHYAAVVPPGTYEVGFEDPTGAHIEDVYWAGRPHLYVNDPFGATQIQVTSSGVTGIDFVMAAANSIRGTVSDAYGPLANIRVVASSGSAGAQFDTTVQGTYLAALAPGTYTLQFMDPSGGHPSGFYSSAGFTIDPAAATSIDLSSSNVAGINVVMPRTGDAPAGTSPAGSNVTVTPAYAGGPSPAVLTFGNVSAAGITTLTASPTAPSLPGGYQIGSPPTYYDLQTTTTYSGNISVCFSYAGVAPPPTVLLHYDSTAGTWVDITSSIDTTDQLVCGTTSSLSPFALVTPVLRQPVILAAATALGARSSGPFTSATRIVRTGQYITVQFELSPAISGARLGIWIARKGSDGRWSAFRPSTSRVANAAGVVRYTYRSTSAGQLAFRAFFVGDAAHRPAWSPARQARWR